MAGVGELRKQKTGVFFNRPVETLVVRVAELHQIHRAQRFNPVAAHRQCTPGKFNYHVRYPRARIGRFDVDLIAEFFHGLANHAALTLHIDGLRGANAHHVAESVFKAFGRAVRMAVARDPAVGGVPSTKGVL